MLAFLTVLVGIASAQELSWQPHPDTGKKFEVTGYVIGFEPFESEQDCRGRDPKTDTKYFADVGDVTKYELKDDPVIQPGAWYYITVYSYNGERRSEKGPALCVLTDGIAAPEEFEASENYGYNETYGGTYENEDEDRKGTFSLGTVSPPSSGPRGNGKANMDAQLQSDGRKRDAPNALAGLLGTRGRSVRPSHRDLPARSPMEDGRRDANLEHDNVDAGLVAGSAVLLPNDSTQRDARIGSNRSRVQDNGDESPSSDSNQNGMIALGVALLAGALWLLVWPNAQRSRLRNYKAETGRS